METTVNAAKTLHANANPEATVSVGTTVSAAIASLVDHVAVGTIANALNLVLLPAASQEGPVAVETIANVALLATVNQGGLVAVGTHANVVVLLVTANLADPVDVEINANAKRSPKDVDANLAELVGVELTANVLK